MPSRSRWQDHSLPLTSPPPRGTPVLPQSGSPRPVRRAGAILSAPPPDADLDPLGNLFAGVLIRPTRGTVWPRASKGADTTSILRPLLGRTARRQPRRRSRSRIAQSRDHRFRRDSLRSTGPCCDRPKWCPARCLPAACHPRVVAGGSPGTPGVGEWQSQAVRRLRAMVTHGGHTRAVATRPWGAFPHGPLLIGAPATWTRLLQGAAQARAHVLTVALRDTACLPPSRVPS